MLWDALTGGATASLKLTKKLIEPQSGIGFQLLEFLFMICGGIYNKERIFK